MSSPFRYDWLEAKARIIEAGENPASFCLVCLPIAGIHLLDALLERAFWEATYRIPGFDYEAYRDEIRDIVDQTENGLMANCDDIINQITTNISNVITNQTTILNTYEDACCYLENQPAIESGPISTSPPLPSELDDLCKAAQKAHDQGLIFLDQVLTLTSVGGGISAGVIGAIAASYIVALPFALLATVIGLLVGITGALSSEQVKTDWTNLKEAIVCAIYTAASPGSAKTAVHAQIDASGAIALAKSLFKAMYNQDQINKIWSNDVGSTAAYSATYCDSCSGENTFVLTYDFTTTNGNFTSLGFGWFNGQGWRNDITDGGEDICRLTYNNMLTALSLPAATPIQIDSLIVSYQAEASVSQSWDLSARIYQSYSSTSTENTITAGPGASGTIEHADPNPQFTTSCSPAFVGKGIGQIGGSQVWRWTSITIRGRYQPLP